MRSKPQVPSGPRIIFESAIGIGFGANVAKIPANQGMKHNQKLTNERRLAKTESALLDGEERLVAMPLQVRIVPRAVRVMAPPS